jgi:hypothetical protein
MIDPSVNPKLPIDSQKWMPCGKIRPHASLKISQSSSSMYFEVRDLHSIPSLHSPFTFPAITSRPDSSGPASPPLARYRLAYEPKPIRIRGMRNPLLPNVPIEISRLPSGQPDATIKAKGGGKGVSAGDANG